MPLARPGVSSVLLGARTVGQLDANLDAASLDLTEDDLRELTEASAPGLPAYPHGFVRDRSGVDP